MKKVILYSIIILFISVAKILFSSSFYESSVRYIGGMNSLITFCDDFDGIYINPASSVNSIYNKSGTISYSRINKTLNWVNIYGGIKFLNMAISGGFINYSTDSLEKINNEGVIIGNSEFYNRIFIINYGLKLKNIKSGINITEREEKMDYYRNESINITLGFLSYIVNNITLSLVLNDLLNNGKAIYGFGFSLPTRRPKQLSDKLGMKNDNLDFLLDEKRIITKNQLNIELDFSHNFEGYLQYISTAIEWWLIETVSMRGGIKYNFYYKSFYFSFGGTFIIHQIRIDYAFYHTIVNDNHYLGIGLIFF